MTQPQPQPGILDIQLYVGGKSSVQGVQDILKLSSNENPNGPPASAQQALAEVARIADLSKWMGPNEREHYTAVLHAIIASYFERLDGIKPTDVAHLTIHLERALKDSTQLLGEPIYRNESWVIDGLTDSGNLRLVHPQHGTEIIADGEDLNWPLMMKN